MTSEDHNNDGRVVSVETSRLRIFVCLFVLF